MYVNATQVREGMIIKLDGELYRVTWKMHRTPGKGDAYMQTKLKNIVNGKNLEYRFRSSDKVEKASVISKSMQYLYDEPSAFVFMDQGDFEQHHIDKDILGDQAKFLKEGDVYQVSTYENQPVGVELPQTIDLEVIHAPPEIRKATASSSLRPVTVTNDITVQAPAFIKPGDMIRINTADGSYIERV